MHYGVLALALPVFVLAFTLEVLAARYLPDDRTVGINARDSATNVAMGLGNLVVTGVWRVGLLAGYAALYAVTPLRLGSYGALSILALVLCDDLAYYAYHRAHHEVRALWAVHVVHHSSERYNFSTAVRQPWLVPTAMPFWLPLALLGFTPVQILMQEAVSLFFQFFLHTERIGKLPRPIEFVFNTPSHHRVHHGTNAGYLDRNYGGILIVWDRLFGTFQAEGERVRYGLTTNITGYSPWLVFSHELRAIGRDLRAATSWRDRAGHLLRGPGWRPVPVPVPVPVTAAA